MNTNVKIGKCENECNNSIMVFRCNIQYCLLTVFLPDNASVREHISSAGGVPEVPGIREG